MYGVREGAKYIVRVVAVNCAGEGQPGLTDAVIVRNPAGIKPKTDVKYHDILYVLIN